VSHDHDHAANANRTRLGIAIGIVSLTVVAEIVGALLSGSLALLADSGHMFSDLLGLIIALVATVVAARPATDRQTFGYRRAEVFGALANGVILSIVALLVAAEGIRRLLQPGDVEVASVPMLIVAAIGLVANLATMAVLRGGATDTINMRGAYLEVLGDLIGSVLAIVAGLVLLFTGFAQADAIASLVIAGLIVPRALNLLRDVFQVLSDAAPRGTDVEQIRSHILDTKGVAAVHDVHVWQITSGAPVFTAHVVVDAVLFSSGGTGRLLDELSICLADHFDVAHSTFQLEPAGFAEQEHEAHP
jgi:cobalt-zinc-cadmium efflux system protein